MNLPTARSAGGHASSHPKKEKREAQNNADIRPFISIGEAAQIALGKIAKAKQDNDA